VYNSAGLDYPIALLDYTAGIIQAQGKIKEIVFQADGPWIEPETDARWESLKKTEEKLMDACEEMGVKTKWLGCIWKV
jgi:hypothetical protein